MTSTNQDTEVLERPDAPPSDLTEAIAAAAPRRWWNRTTLALLGVVLLIGGFLGGVQAQERWGARETVRALPGASAAPSAPATPATDTAGTVKLVDGRTLYLQTASGETVTVRTTDATLVKLAQTVPLSSLTAGRQVTVAGATDDEGIVNATTVTAG